MLKWRDVMESRMHWADRPLWVRIGLLGIPSRRAAMLWMKSSLTFVILALAALIAAPILLGKGLVGVGMSMALAALLGPVMLIAPLWYWLAIQWTDEHEGWATLSWRT